MSSIPLGILFEAFEDSAFWWQSVTLARRALLVGLDAALFRDAVEKFLALALVNLAILILQVSPTILQTQAVCLCVLSLSIMLSVSVCLGSLQCSPSEDRLTTAWRASPYRF
jgi:hypothetical protein